MVILTKCSKDCQMFTTKNFAPGQREFGRVKNVLGEGGEKKGKGKEKRFHDTRVKKDWQLVLLNEDKELSNCSVEGN